MHIASLLIPTVALICGNSAVMWNQIPNFNQQPNFGHFQARGPFNTVDGQVPQYPGASNASGPGAGFNPQQGFQGPFGGMGMGAGRGIPMGGMGMGGRAMGQGMGPGRGGPMGGGMGARGMVGGPQQGGRPF